MSEADNDKEVLAAEYALGVIEAEGRAKAHMLLAIDPEFAAAIARWEGWLGGLEALIDPVEPPPSNWEWIKARIAAIEPSGQIWLPSEEEAAAAQPIVTPAAAAPAAATPEATAAASSPAPPVPGADPQDVHLSGRVRQWRWLAVAALALAAVVGGLAIVRELRPALLPHALRPAPRIVEKTIEVVREVPSQRMAEFVAVFQREGAAPAFVLSLDSERRIVSIRRLETEPAAEGDYELWIDTPQAPRPRSLGLIDDKPFTVRRTPAEYDVPALRHATFGISLEPAGGSPTGQPSGPMLRAKLIQIAPAAFPTGLP